MIVAEGYSLPDFWNAVAGGHVSQLGCRIEKPVSAQAFMEEKLPMSSVLVNFGLTQYSEISVEILQLSLEIVLAALHSKK